MICLAITITLNYTKVFGNISMLICKWWWDEELICLYVGVHIFIIFLFFYNCRDWPPYEKDPDALLPPVPQNTPKFWGVSTRPQCAFPRSHAPASRKLGGTLYISEPTCTICMSFYIFFGLLILDWADFAFDLIFVFTISSNCTVFI